MDEDNPTTRSFLATLPVTLAFSDYGGKEKVATPTGEGDFTDAEGDQIQESGSSSPPSRRATSGSSTTPTGTPSRTT
ncbi:cyclophilin-like fold protein [Arthrobacter sp. Soil761]|uniref:cyclophilin-like fold protein n=1 Tax=Arthrobacter sp. Soil761 TaxID=1736400 RepID=UPI001EED8A04|nr:cyclophilin-like fold protein [Arthrobacter sp. Soil761]